MDGSEPAKAAVEMALWDIAGKVAGRPVYDLLGGKVHDQVFIRWGLAFGPPGAGVEEIAPWIEQGVRTIKVKIGRPGTGPRRGDGQGRPRRRARHGINVMVDANSGYRTPLQAVQEISGSRRTTSSWSSSRSTASAWPNSRSSASTSSTPILADESMRHWPDAYDVARHGAADALGIYICEAGGILAALNAAAIGEAAGLVVTIGSQCELGIGTAAMAHAAVCMPNLAFESRHHGPPALPGRHHQRAARLPRRRDPSARRPRPRRDPQRRGPRTVAARPVALAEAVPAAMDEHIHG